MHQHPQRAAKARQQGQQHAPEQVAPPPLDLPAQLQAVGHVGHGKIEQIVGKDPREGQPDQADSEERGANGRDGCVWSYYAGVDDRHAALGDHSREGHVHYEHEEQESCDTHQRDAEEP